MSEPRIAILMAVYNGAAVLPQQLASFAAQTHTNWHLVASIDPGTDASAEVLAGFGHAHPVTSLTGPGQGGTANFMSLIARSAKELAPGDWIAFSDQDDVWLDDRLARGVAALQGITGPALYCSKTWITDPDLQGRRLSPPRPKPLGFRNALVQNVVAGNTILMNAEAAQVVIASAQELDQLPVVHDWWVYQLLSGAGARLIHDDTPTLLYRQHGDNQIGANDSARARLVRVLGILNGTYKGWHDRNIAVLGQLSHRLTPAAREDLSAFASLRGKGLLGRMQGLAQLGLYRQSRISTVALWLSALCRRL